jgi:ubiquitin-protein ligase
MYHWQVEIKFISNSLFVDRSLKLNISFPTKYPFIPPKIEFITEINDILSKNAQLELESYKYEWFDACIVEKYILTL